MVEKEREIMCSDRRKHKERSFRGMPSFKVHYSSRRNKDVPGYEEMFLLGRYRAGYWVMGKAVLELPTDKGRTTEAKWISLTIRDLGMEMRYCFYGFYRWIAEVKHWK